MTSARCHDVTDDGKVWRHHLQAEARVYWQALKSRMRRWSSNPLNYEYLSNQIPFWAHVDPPGFKRLNLIFLFFFVNLAVLLCF